MPEPYKTKAAGPTLSPIDPIPALAAEAEPVTDPAVPTEEPHVIVAAAAAAANPTRLVGSGHPSELSVVANQLFTLVGS
ncbi:hypothetical protein UCDDA912_g05322 [Diaporthe ampelina]|uniref:Uncharacterized protein n=1 Tax=Diaporthe ampelina TaxID=1214573 RepID=A0A0G2FK02_9PEZI|nr:hypothetical protein UCDDA912_g05322 [Diaporthe ampelina]